jgi:Protein of unknown function (DUF4241)
MNPARLLAGMTQGSRLETMASDNTFIDRVRIGTLALPTGRVIACDPYYSGDATAFSKSVCPGEYPVDLSIASFTSTNQHVALAILVFRDAQPVSWELAHFDGGQVVYGVDYGVGCFMDANAVPLVCAKLDEGEQFLADRMSINNEAARDWQNIELDRNNRLNLIVFPSGRGDGAYSSYWGFDDNDDVVCLVTDFDILEELPTAPESLRSEPPTQSPPGRSGDTIFVSPW